MKTGEPVLLIRADAGRSLGTGHVMRCFALAQEWRERTGGAVWFASTQPLAESLRARIEQEEFGTRVIKGEPSPGSEDDALGLLALGDEYGAERIVVDHYDAGEAYQRALRENGPPFLVVDDFQSDRSFHSQWTLNQNLHASEDLYPRIRKGTRLLLGTRYALLRHEFTRKGRPVRETPARASKLLVSVGGSDPSGINRRVAEALALLDRPDLEALFVVGGVAGDTRDLETRLTETSGKCRVVSNLNDMYEPMAWADLAVTAGGGTTHETMFMGLPSLLVVVAENQAAHTAAAHSLSVAESLGWHVGLTAERIAERLTALFDDPLRRRTMTEACRAQNDGRGAGRVVSELTEATGIPQG